MDHRVAASSYGQSDQSVHGPAIIQSPNLQPTCFPFHKAVLCSLISLYMHTTSLGVTIQMISDDQTNSWVVYMVLLNTFIA